jgi:hypothetical protein
MVYKVWELFELGIQLSYLLILLGLLGAGTFVFVIHQVLVRRDQGARSFYQRVASKPLKLLMLVEWMTSFFFFST